MPKDFTGRAAMGSIGSPVVLITAAHDGRANIMTANMIAGLQFKPSLLCVSLGVRSFTLSLIDKSGEFAVNVISPEQLDLAKKVGTTSGYNVNKFDEFSIEVEAGEAVSCPLVAAAHTTLECKVENTIDLDTHKLYIARVIAYRETNRESPLYLYHGQFHSIGKQVGSYYRADD